MVFEQVNDVNVSVDTSVYMGLSNDVIPWRMLMRMPIAEHL